VIAVALVVTAIDAASKWWARRSLIGHTRHVFGPLWLRLQFNTGISFSLSSGWPLISTVLTVIVALAVLVIALRARAGIATWGFGLLVGGGLGNVLDRLAATPHRVTDFVAYGSFPVFNVADVAISAGFVLLLLQLLRGERLVNP
jgi:signal peptidase II